MMSKRLVTLTVAVFVLLLPAFVSADLTSSLVAYYPFNGNANDESGNGNNGTVYGATLTSDRFGNPDSAYSFDGLDDYIEVPNADSLNPAAVTISAWFNIYSYGSPGWCNFPTLIFKQSPKDVDNTYYAIALMNDYPGWTVGCLSSSTWSVSGPNAYVASLQPLPLGEWHHVVATINSTEVREYIDGQLQGVSSTGFPLDPGSRPLYIGYTGMFCGAYWNGLIDEVRIYNRALTEAEIQALYDKTVICQVRHNGDYDPDPGSLGNLVAEIKSRTGGNDISSSFVTLDSVPVCNMLYITGHYPFSFTETQRTNLKTYLQNGGLIFADDCSNYLDYEGFESSFRTEIYNILGRSLEPLPTDHLVFSSFYVLSGTLATAWNNEPLEGINIGEKTAVIYSDNDYGCAWEGAHGECDSTCRENSFEMGTNIALYGLLPTVPNLEVSPSSHDFGELQVGTCSAVPQQFTLSNTGNADLQVTDITLSDYDNFILNYDPFNGGLNPCLVNNPIIKPGGFCTVSVAFSPSTMIGTINTNLTITSNDPDTLSFEVNIMGTGLIQEATDFVYPVLALSQTDPLENKANPIGRGWHGNPLGVNIGVKTNEKGHLGQDYIPNNKKSVSQTVYAVANGEIVEVLNGSSRYGWCDNDHHGWGPVVVIKHKRSSGFNVSNDAILKDNCITDRNPTEIYSLYGHLSKESVANLYVGKPVEMGDAIGEIGEWGIDPNWPWRKDHLHFELKDRIGFLEGSWYRSHPGTCPGSAAQSCNVQGIGTAYSGKTNFAPHRYIPSAFIESN
jgi:hypothetical protein